jgi:hypothetical protein
MKRWMQLAGWAITLWMGTGSAWAFPTWMGVYGAHQRHDGGNPGTFTILMNQDYFGLHAEVGVQVNGGAWTTYGMTYAGNVNGNSKWTAALPQAFPAGATVKYYFHGFDNWGGHIYDSQNAQNYTLTIPGGGGALAWSAPADLPLGAGATSPDIASYNGQLYAAWGTRSNEYDSPLQLWLARKSGNAWQAPTFVAQVASAWASPRIAVSAGGVHLAFTDYAQTYYIRSENDGQTWTSPIVVSNALYPELRADADYAYLVFNRYSPPDVSRIFFTRIYKNDSAFSAPVQIFSNVGYKTTVYVRDLDVIASRVHLLTYAQSWYGGYVQYFVHESQDAGQTWSGGQQPGAGAHLAGHADGRASYAAVDGGPGGAGIYFQSKPYAGSWISYLNIWSGEGTCDALRRLNGALVTVSQRGGLRYGRTSADNGITWSSPALMDTRNGWSVKDVADAGSMHLLLMDQAATGMAYYTVSTTGSGGVPVQWIGNTYHWPGNGEIDPWDAIWVNTETYPKNAATNVQIVYSINGGINWTARSLEYAGGTAANDQWHLNLGMFSAGTTVRYAVVASDAAGLQKWDNNGGQDYAARVSSSSAVPAPVFWGLDPYRYDNEKVRVNGQAGYGGRQFGEFAAGPAITVVARPVENGNGNNVQTACSIVSKLHYTTTPGQWDNAVTVTGVFHAAGFSNKPIFDYFTYSLGTLPAGSQVEFWLEAQNAGGTTYGQEANHNFTFSIAGSTNGDGDNDGLPDQWETDWIGHLGEDADDNNDGDGPIGRPLANIIEWLTGNHPQVPNDPSGIRLLWAPAYPQPGETVTLSYFYVNEGNPLFGKPVYAHVGRNGWQGTYDTAALQPNGQIGRFEIQVQVPADATELNVVFHDNAGTWDSNSGQDWRIPVRPAAAPSPAVATSGSSTIKTTPVTAPAQDMNITLKLLGVHKSRKVFAHVGRNGWKKAVDVAMTRQKDGSLTAAYKMPAGHADLNVAFRDGQGRWYTNGGGGWVFKVAGNGDQTIVIGK